jgi:inner membrane protein
MDNIAHTLLGLALARAGFERTGPLVTPVLAVGANLPDIDIVVRFRGHLDYLHEHRGITHALPGMGVEAPLLAVIAYALGRLHGVDRLRFLPLLLAASVGLLSHLLLDGLNTYGVRPWLPFSETRYYGDAAFIVDPWLWLALGAGAYLGTERGPRANGIWMATAGLAVLLAGSSPHGQGAVAAVFFVGVIAIALAKRFRVVRERPQLWALAGLAAALGHVGVLLVASHVALGRGLAALEPLRGGEPPVRASANPEPGVPWRSAIVLETERTLRFAAVDLLAGTADTRGSLEKHLDDPALRGLEETREVRTWRWFARHPFVARSADGELILGDARYDPHPRPGWCNLAVPLAGR